MRKKAPVPAPETVCPSCQEPSLPDDLIRCMICHTFFCRKCAYYGYGRDFCSNTCAQFFFHGDDEDLGEEE